jgi:hypothetical protein
VSTRSLVNTRPYASPNSSLTAVRNSLSRTTLLQLGFHCTAPKAWRRQRFTRRPRLRQGCRRRGLVLVLVTTG